MGDDTNMNTQQKYGLVVEGGGMKCAYNAANLQLQGRDNDHHF